MQQINTRALIKKSTFKRFITNTLISLIAAIYSFRAYFYGYLLGDEYDTRLMISQHEHWYRLFFKDGIFRDTLYFYPTQDALGFTDAFLIPSFIYTPLRFLGLGILEAWSLASFLTLTIGFLGWLYLIDYLIKNKILKIALFLNLILLPAWVAQFEFFPNAIGYSFISWLLYLFFKTIDSKAKNHFFLNLNIFILIFILVALTTWYPAAFFALILLPSLPYLYKKYRYLPAGFTKSVENYLTNFLILLVNVLLLITWSLIYLPKLTETTSLRNWEEVIANSLNIKDLVNPINLNNGVIFFLVKNGNTGVLEVRNLGFALFLTIFSIILISFIFLNFSNWRTHFLTNIKYKEFFYLVVTPSVIIGLIFLKLTNTFSFYRLFWEHVPGMSSIRYPYRFYIVLGFVLWIFIFMTLDLYLRNHKTKIKQVVIYFLVLSTALDNFKPLYTFWTPEDYLPKVLHEKKSLIQKTCDYFILDRPGGWWDDATKSIALSAITGVPTANGQSSAYPNGYPAKPLLYEGDISEILAWAGFGISNKQGCFVSDSFEPIVSSAKEPRLEVYDGFSPKESNSNSFWNWSTSSKSTFLISIPKNRKQVSLVMEIKTPPCINERELVFKDMQKGEILSTKINSKSRFLEVPVINNEFGLIKIEIQTDENYCNIDGDPRNLFYEIKNYKLQ